MVVIALKSQYVSLIVTFISGAAELALLFAALRYNTFLESIKLQNGGKLNVRNHRTRTRVLAVLATLAFIVLEVFNSFYSDPTQNFRIQELPCSTVDRLSASENGFELFGLSDLAVLRCVDINRTYVTVRSGYVSEEEDARVQCNGDLFGFQRTIPDVEVLPDSGFVYECDKHPDDPDLDDFYDCVFVYRNGSEVTVTQHVRRTYIQVYIEEKEPLSVFKTDLMYDGTGMERLFAKRAIQTFIFVVTDEIARRRETFAQNGNGTCDFRIPTDATELSLGLIYALIVVWVVSFAALLSSAFLNRMIFYDMSDPLHWAQKVVIERDLQDLSNPVIKGSTSSGDRSVVVSSSSRERGHSRTGFLTLFNTSRQNSALVDNGNIDTAEEDSRREHV